MGERHHEELPDGKEDIREGWGYSEMEGGQGKRNEMICSGWELSSGHKRLLKTNEVKVGRDSCLKKKRTQKNFFPKPEYSPSKYSFPRVKPCHRFGEEVVGIRQPGGEYRA